MSSLVIGAPGSQDLSARSSRLRDLYVSVNDAANRGDVRDALRLADAARRIAGDDPTTSVIYARLLLRCGHDQDALALLGPFNLPSARVTRAEALCLLGRFDEARHECSVLLAECAVDCVEGLTRVLSLIVERDPSGFAGWVGFDSTTCMVGVAPAGSQLVWEQEGLRSSCTLPSQTGERWLPFQQVLQDFVRRSVSVECSAGHLFGSPLVWPLHFGYAGWVIFEGTELRGEVQTPWAPGRPVALEVGTIQGEMRRCDLPPSKAELAEISFAIPVSERTNGPISVDLLLPGGGRLPMVGSPLDLRARAGVLPITGRPARESDAAQALLTPRDGRIDIVIPVFAGRKETLRCIASVLTSAARDEIELIVVNDSSPDLELSRALENLAKANRITLVENETNLGFPGTVNRGMQLHPQRDVVLLNADCEVFGDWLTRLRSAAYGSHDIATVTPFGENASIASYLGPADSGSRVDAIARLVNTGKTVDVPVGVGFCLYVKRSCLDEIGLFEEEQYGRGYGEENDFCLRARRVGWRHVVAADVFVRHSGGRSFGPERELLMARNGRVLNALYPGYDDLVLAHTKADPLRGARRAIDIRRLIEHAEGAVLLMTHALGGGVQHFVDERVAELASVDQAVIVMTPRAKSWDRVRLALPGGSFENLAFEVPEDTALLTETLRALNLTAVEVHHFLNLPETILEEALHLGVPYSVYLHDYSWLCPRLTLLGGDDTYCGEPEIDACEKCATTHGSAFPESLSVTELRGRSARLLANAEEVYCATSDVRTRFERYFPRIPIQIVSWEAESTLPKRAPPPPEDRIRVAVIGALSVQKGHRLLLECAQAAAAENLALDFVLIGYSSDDQALLDTGRIFITGPYQEKELASLLERERCRVALFPSVTPETWCRTLSSALADGMPIVALDIGAVAERLRGRDTATLLPLASSANEINQCLLAAAVGKTAARLELADHSDSRGAAKDGDHTGLEPAAVERSASVQMLTLPQGVYTFSIRSGATEGGYGGSMAMPALHVGLAPAEQQARVDFFSGRGTLDRWLAFRGDQVVARILGENAGLLLTSVRRAEDVALAIDVRRIDVPLASDTQSVFSAQIMVHVREMGDVFFPAHTVGPLGLGLWIEAFVVNGADNSGAEIFEYKGVTADGFETPWLTDSVLCGSRGRGTPLLGFAVRPRVAFAKTLGCSYTGHFASGSRVGPVAAGGMCRSDLPDDPLEGFELHFVARE